MNWKRGIAAVVVVGGLGVTGLLGRRVLSQRSAEPVGAIRQSEVRPPAEPMPSPALPEQNDSRTDGGGSRELLTALALTSFTTLIAVATSARQYRLRRVLLKDQQVVFPEYLAESLDKLRHGSGSVVETLREVGALTERRSNQILAAAGELGTSFLTLQSSLDEKDLEIRRLKQGYDRAVFGAYLKRFLRVHDALDDALSGEELDRSAVEQVRALLLDAFDDSGLESFSPELGSDFSSAAGVGERPKRIVTTEPAEDRKILEVLEVGYRYRTPDGYEVVRDARVAVGVLQDQEEEQP